MRDRRSGSDPGDRSAASMLTFSARLKRCPAAKPSVAATAGRNSDHFEEAAGEIFPRGATRGGVAVHVRRSAPMSRPYRPALTQPRACQGFALVEAILSKAASR